MTVSILIINWNGERFLDGCLESLRQKISVPFEVVLVDNCSSDQSRELIAAQFPWVKLIRSEQNLGFAGGNNLAARNATGKYLLLLNNDTVLQTDIVDAIAALDRDERIGAVGAAMYGRTGEPRLSCAHFPTPGRLWHIGSLWYTPNGRNWPSPSGVPLFRCDFVEGSFLLTRADLWRQVEGMDERNYMYGDDVDYCRSLCNIGRSTAHCPSVRYVHFGGYDNSRIGYIFAGFRRYHRKFSSPWVRLKADLVLRIGLALRLPWYWVRAAFKRDAVSRNALTHAVALHQNWSDTLVDGHRFHSS